MLSFARRLPHAFVLLFPSATVTVLLAANPQEGVRVGSLTNPLLMAVLVAAATWLVVGFVTRDRLKRSIAATVVTLLLLMSGYVFAWLRAGDLPLITRAFAELTAVSMLAIAGVSICVRTNWGKDWARFLNLFAVLVIGLSLPALYRASTELTLVTDRPTVLPDTADIIRPDIYLIVTDGYTGDGSLSRIYAYDNEPFLEVLRGRGFKIPDNARSNYVKTFLSIGTMLNRQYYDELDGPTTRVQERSWYHKRMEFSTTAIDLKRLGYRFYFVGSSYPPLATNALADAQYSTKPSQQFGSIWSQTTALLPLLQLCFVFEVCRTSDLPFRPESASKTQDRLKYLSSLVDRESPKFVYAHLLLPHGPYRFNAECDQQPPRWTVGPDAIRDDSLEKMLYVAQIQCTNRQLVHLVDRILDSPQKPIVILQSDHGHGRFPGEMPTNLSEASPDQVSERFDVFAAYAGPGSIADSLASQRTPVNIFRALFRVQWGVDEPPLPDRHYWSEGKDPLELRKLTLD